MQHLLPIIKTALNRLQPPLKHAAYSPPSPPPLPPPPLHSPPLAPPSLSNTLALCRLRFEIGDLPPRQLPLSNSSPAFLLLNSGQSGLSAGQLDRGKSSESVKWQPSEMDLIMILCCLLLFLFNPAVATSLITGKIYFPELTMDPSLVPHELTSHYFFRGCVTSQRICLKPKVGNTLPLQTFHSCVYNGESGIDLIWK